MALCLAQLGHFDRDEMPELGAPVELMLRGKAEPQAAYRVTIAG